MVGQSNFWNERLGEIATVYGKHCGVKGQPAPLDALRAAAYMLLAGLRTTLLITKPRDGPSSQRPSMS